MTDEPTYVHDPDAVDAESGAAATDEEADLRDAEGTADAAATGEEFDWRGWLLVAAVVVAFLVVPGALYVFPTVRGAIAGLGLGWRNTYLVLPLIPAFLLGAIAVWSAVNSQKR